MAADALIVGFIVASLFHEWVIMQVLEVLAEIQPDLPANPYRFSGLILTSSKTRSPNFSG